MKANEFKVLVSHVETMIDRDSGRASFSVNIQVEYDRFFMLSEGMIVDGREFASGVCALCDDSTYWCDKVACKSVQGEELLKYPEREWDFTGCDADFAEFVREVEFSLTCRTPDALKRKVIDAIADALIARVC